MGKRAWIAVLPLLLLIPVVRFGPTYLAAARASALRAPWRDTAMDSASRAAAEFTRGMARPGDTLLVWGYRPEIYTYTGLPAATIYLETQALTGVPADRHLTQSQPVETEAAARRRAELTRSRPEFLLDGLGLYNPALAITAYPELREWLSQYREVGRVGQTIVYRLQ